MQSEFFGGTGGRIFNVEMDARWLRHFREYSVIGEQSNDFRGGSVAWLMSKLYHEFCSMDHISALVIEGLTLEIIAAASRQFAAPGNRTLRWLERARDILHEHFDDNLTLACIATMVGVHPVHLASSFRKKFHCTIGWLGKPYAMQQALNHARGEWILATDADMVFDKAALRTAVDSTLERKGDAMTLIPHFEASSFWERVMTPTWAWVLLIFTMVYRISNPKTRGAVGIGGFFLMRRAVRDEVLEDVRLAEMIKRSGAHLFTEYAPNLLSTHTYRNFGEMWECSTKNWFSGMKFSLPFALASVFSMYLMSVVPPLIALASAIGIAAGVSADLWLLFIPAVLSWLLQVLALAMVSLRSEVLPAYALTAPLGLSLLYAMLFDSSIRITTGKGVTWKGRRIYESRGVRPPRFRSAASHVPNIEE